MKRIIMIAAILLLLLPGTLLAAAMGESAGHDLDALWSQAQAQFDLKAEDAVLLLESRQVTFSHDGAMQTRVHRVVWIGTAVGVRSYADLRIPWNSATSTLDVEILRTWRQDPGQTEGRWWPDAEKVSPTAVVPTLPHALDKADDYTVMRETMLLHDGVELGCIMETAYIITERGVPASGGIFVMPQDDPVVLCELRVMTPPGTNINHEELNGAAVPELLNPTKGAALLWRGKNLPALRQPVTANPEAYEPTVVWSTWKSWQELADHWLTPLRSAASLDPDQAANLQAKLNPAQSPRQKLAAIGDYLNEMVRGVHYDDGFWRFAPRSASRTLATAYGHDLDRTALAVAMLQEAGFGVEPMFIGHGSVLVSPDLPRLQDLGRVLVHVPLVRDTCFDPATGKVLAYDETYGHPFWYVGSEGAASGPHPAQLPEPSRSLTVSLSLAQGDTGTWSGEGYFLGLARFSHYGEVRGDEDLRSGYVSRLASSVLPGVEVTAAVPVLLGNDAVEISFAVDVAAGEPDAAGRKIMVVGRPAGGLLDRLPGDVHLFEETRQSSVLGLENWVQTVVVRLEVAEEQLLHRPAPKNLTNQAGTFSLEVEYKEGWLTLTRTISLSGDPLGAKVWPELRALLLEEDDVSNGTVILN